MDTSMPVQSAADAPRTETENILVEIWSAVLNTRDIDIHADFFSMGETHWRPCAAPIASAPCLV
jgi:hypothetical protein